ncbi:MAG TPA: hypothetical protein VK249_00740 [Anaerolineales bacterium]|nr:hypothetical protein [Anaerolineales bacterium]
MNEELTTLIIKELGKYQDRKQVIRKVCEQGGFNWKEAERLIILVEARHRRTMRVHPRPLLLFLSIVTLFLGIGLLAFNMQFLLALFQKNVLGQTLNLQTGNYRIMGVIAGSGITAGGLVGLWKAFLSIFPD